MADMMAAQGTQTEPTTEPEESAEFTLCIEIYADGTIKVGEEKEEAEGQEMSMEDDSGMTTVDSIDAALKMARAKLEEHQSSGEGMNPFDIGANKVLNPAANKGQPNIPMPTGMPA